MPEFRATSTLAAPQSAVWAFHANPGAFERLMPPWQTLIMQSWSGTLRDARVQFALKQGPIKLQWIAQHDPQGFIDGQQFVDVQLKGPAAAWRHTHRVTTAPSTSSSTLDDHIVYRLPLHPVGQALGGWKFQSDLRTLFAFRHARTLHDALRHARFATQPRLRIVLTGSQGTIGRALLGYLINAGHTVDRLIRAPSQPRPTGDGTPLLPGREISWDPTAPEASPQVLAALDGADAVIHLAGVPIAERRWTPARKAAIASSRIDSTTQLARAIARCPQPPRAVLVASGVNIYRPASPTDRTARDESAPLDNSFLADVATRWEAAAAPARSCSRVVHLRLGVVLSAKGGFLQALTGPPLPPKAAVSRFGDGRNILPWIHIDDTLAAIEHILHTPSLAGPLNLVAPALDEARTVHAAITRAAGAWLALPVPTPLLRAIAGEMADSIIASQPTAPAALLASGFRFAHISVQHAVGMELGHLPSLTALPPQITSALT
ncbi:MAG: TIGR01777 family oxidoreductase [Phycisphaerales bacterium]|nr:TIGR01777 family oxidoreductase [Phycisphaerales bacterium]